MNSLSETKNGATNLSIYDNSWYKSGPGWKIGLWMLCDALIFANRLVVSSSFKCRILRWFGASIGNAVMIKPLVRVKYPWFLTIGDYAWIGEEAWIDNLSYVTIGAHVCLSQGSYLCTGNHNFQKKAFDLIVKPIVLEDGVWIGAKSTVCPGVVCGSHSILTVGSTATRNLEPYSIYQGNPAVLVKRRTIDDE